MNYLDISKCSVCNGIGFRTVLWVSGCEHHCVGCQNPESWDFCNGQIFTEETFETLINLLEPDYIRGITLSGGDPLNPKNVIVDSNTNKFTIYNLILELRKRFRNNKDIWVYTGYTWAELLDFGEQYHEYRYILQNIDVLVDGKFDKSCRDITLPFRGSKNQHLIDVSKSLSMGRLIPWNYSEVTVDNGK